MPRRLVAALAVGAGLALASLFVTDGLLFYRPLPTIDGTWRLLGLHERGEIVRDAHGIPHVDARNLHDLFFLQGYATAQDRLLQMELLRLMARGRLGEVAGEAAAASDARMAALDLPRAAAGDLPRASEATRAALEAYAAGVTKFIAQHAEAKALPGELVLLGRRPAPWSAADSVAVAAAVLLREPSGGTCIATSGAAAFKGRPLIAAELDVGGPFGDTWYEIGLEGAGLRARGFALPGVPGILVGYGERIAWSLAPAITRLAGPFVATRPDLGAMADGLLGLSRASDAESIGSALTKAAIPFEACFADDRGAAGTIAPGQAPRAADAAGGVIVAGSPRVGVGLSFTPGGADAERLRVALNALRPRPIGNGGLRLIVDLAEPDAAWAALPSGQSGHRASMHAYDQRALWEAGQLHRLGLSRQSLGKIEGHLVFRPR